MATASSASGASCSTFNEWNFSISQALEVIERLAAGAAAVVRFAGRRAELAHAGRVAARAPRATHARRAEELAGTRDGLLRRCNAERSQLVPSRGSQPVAAPGWRQHLLEDRMRKPAGIECRA